ncbi:unnamed protein product [Schistocephalus solidus]|uniref:Uncharacterized protein n=1 Tax=Schistocephalus solidus TaxID=70667 RepID=A0A183T0Z1_SCHSO|nr:unnamed protein product [Schistocephalus solidus]
MKRRRVGPSWLYWTTRSKTSPIQQISRPPQLHRLSSAVFAISLGDLNTLGSCNKTSNVVFNNPGVNQQLPADPSTPPSKGFPHFECNNPENSGAGAARRWSHQPPNLLSNSAGSAISLRQGLHPS